MATMQETIKLRVDTAQAARWRGVATSRGLSKMIRQAVDEYVERVSSSGKSASKPEDGGSIPPAHAEAERAGRERAQMVAAMRELIVRKASKPAPRPEPLDVGGRRCPDHPNLLVGVGQTRCRHVGCFQRIP